MTPELKGFILLSAVKLLVVFSVTMVGIMYMTLMERWVSAWMQDRKGPNRVGWKGILQPIADGVKNLIKEETFPPHTNRILFLVAPALSFIPALLMGSVIPWASPIPVKFDFTLPLLGQFTHDGLMAIQVADLPIGFLFVLAVGSVGVYGIALAGWSSNSKYSLLGGLRSSAQMVSYEIAMGMSLIPVLLLAGNVRFTEIIASQQDGLWYVLPLFISFFIFGVAGLAEINRAPFDLPEAESELVAGYHTEYSAFKFSMFFIAEYANMMTYGAMLSILFFGGWDIPFTRWDETPGLLQSIATGLMMFLKVAFGIFVVMWLRWTLPRFRFDQLMSLGWKFMIPVALSYIMIMTLAIWAVDTMVPGDSLRLRQLILFGLNIVLGWILFVILDRGTVIAGAYRVPRGSKLMAIGVKVMKRPERQVSYVRATLKGMALTFKHMFRPAITMQYPEEKSTADYTITPRWRGTHRMATDEQGRSKCVACGLCPQICPANCIKLVPGEDEEGNRYPLIYEIDEFRCVFCGYCQEVCPEEAIHVGVHYENSEYSRDRFVYDLERLMSQTHPVSTLWDPADPRGE